MPTDDEIRTEDVERAAEVAHAHDARDALAALAFDVISRQAEGEKLFAGKEWVDARAAEHDVTREVAETKLGNVLEVLERGPERAGERALLGAFAVLGLGARLAKEDGNEASVLARFVRHADWLETASPQPIYAFVDPVLEGDAKDRVWNAIADACVSQKPAALRFAGRARAAVRVSALATSKSDAAREGLERIARHAEDPAVRALAAFAFGGGASLGSEEPGGAERGAVSVRGRVGRPRRGAVLEVLRVLSGVAAVLWTFRALGALVGLVRTRDLSLAPGGVRVVSETRLLGRVVRAREETFATNGLASIAEATRYPIVHALVGLAFSSVGVLAGGLLAFDAVRSGETWVLVVAAGLVLVGAGTDLALEVFFPKRKDRVALELAVLPGRTVRVDDVPTAEARRFLEAVRKRFS
jgi:hypothetical protein